MWYKGMFGSSAQFNGLLQRSKNAEHILAKIARVQKIIKRVRYFARERKIIWFVRYLCSTALDTRQCAFLGNVFVAPFFLHSIY